MRIHGVSLDYIDEMRAYSNRRISSEQLISMRIHGVSPEFIEELEALGYDRVSPDELISMRIHGVTISFIERARNRGFNDLSIDDMVSMLCEGWFREGRGPGHFTFMPGEDFTDKLARRGFDPPTDEQQFFMALDSHTEPRRDAGLYRGHDRPRLYGSFYS